MNSHFTLVAQLEELLENQSFFECKRLWLQNQDALNLAEKRYFEARLLNAFNNSAESEKVIVELLKEGNLRLSKKQYYQLFKTRLHNAITLSNYSQAWKIGNKIFSDYKEFLTSREIEEFENEQNIWKGLARVPKQKVTKSGDSIIPLKKDKVGLTNIPVSFPAESLAFLFDTGANFSVISQSLAQRLDLEIIEADFYVQAITGKKVKSQLAIARKMEIGALHFENVVFLVFNDADLAVPQLDYQIHGVVGFPVISAMEELHCATDQIFVPKHPKEYRYSNMALDGLTPLVEVNYKGEDLPFSFDTGAQFTLLYKPFYDKYQAELDARYEKSTLNIGGAGGNTKFEGMKDISAELRVGGQAALLDKLLLHTTNKAKEDTFLFGNLGQDFIQKFETMILSFKHSAIEFRGKL